jgi:hypothetical protein
LFDSNNVTDVATSIQALLDGRYKDSKHDKEDLALEHDYAAPGKGEEKEHENCLNILRNAICLWRTYLQLTETFGNKVVDIESIGINAKNSLENQPSSLLSSIHAEENNFDQIANAWGFQVVDIPGDGNCFFTAVAFHLQQIVADRGEDFIITRNYLESIGINSEQSIPTLANFLRRLIVDEWTGSFTSEYQGFLTDTIIEDEAELFLNSGHYSSSLGDAMPLAMANVLRLPILILTPTNLIPLTTIYPRDNVECVAYTISL